MDNKIIWLASYPKSGNTWVRLFLASFVRDSEEFNPNEALSVTSGDAAPDRVDAVMGIDSRKLDFNERMAVRLVYLKKILEQAQGHLVLKTHTINGRWQDIPLVPANLTKTAVYIIRHPFDVCVSFAKHTGTSLDDAIAFLAMPNAIGGDPNQLNQPYGSWSQHVESWTGHNPSQHLVVRFEDMKARPRLVFGNIMAQLGMRPDYARLDRALAQTAFDSLKKFEQEQGFDEQSAKNAGGFFGAGQQGVWKGKLSDGQRARLWANHGAVASRFGYGPQGEA